MKKVLMIAGVAIALLSVAAFVTAPSAMQPQNELPQLPDDLDLYLQQTEAKADHEFGLIPETEKRIRWHGGAGNRKTPLSVVYFHGFSASRQEIAPVGDMIADQLGANLYEARLRGHGRETEQLEDITAEDWLADAAEALSIGAAIGDRVVVMGTSTGATLALAMFGHPLMQDVDALIMMAPNLVLRDTNSEVLTWPGGAALARMVIGSTQSWEPSNEAQAIYWTTSYPLDAVIELMRLVKFARLQMPQETDVKLLTISSPRDSVVDSDRSYTLIKTIAAPVNQLIEFEYSSNDSQHVLAGDILSPDTNEAITDLVVSFVGSERGQTPTSTTRFSR